MSWKEILKREQEVFSSLKEVKKKYKQKISNAIGLLKKMKKEITIENVKNEIVEPLRQEVYGPYQEEFTLKEKEELIKQAIKHFEGVGQIMSENRPLNVPSLAEFEMDYIDEGMGHGRRIKRIYDHVPAELIDKFRQEFPEQFRERWFTDKPVPHLSAKELTNWVNQNKN